MEIAVGVYGDGLVIAQAEGHIGFFAGLEILALTAVFGLDINPFDVVLIGHRMIYAANVDVDCSVFNGHGGQVLLVAGFDGIGNQLFHRLAAAYDGNAGIIDLFDDIMTFAPSFRNLSAVAKPMPLLPPVMMATLSFSLILRTSFLFDGYIIPNFNPHDRDKITMLKLIVALLRKKHSAWALCDFITENKLSSGYTVIKQNERGWHNGSYEYKLKEAQGND